MKKVLIIDDNENDSLLIETKLKKTGINCKVFTSRTGEDGIKSADDIRPDIVIIDTNLPRQDGFQVCKKMKSKFGDSIKIIIITGYVDAVDAVKARRSGADDYSIKTSDVANLIKKVANLIKLD